MSLETTTSNVKIPTIHVGIRLSLAREETGLTQTAFGDEMGVSRATVSRWEQGKGVRKSTILLYAMRTGVPAEWIETGRYTPWDLNPEPTVSGFGRRRNFQLAAVSFLGGADNAALLAA